MIGFLRLAFLMIFRDQAKYLTLVGGLAFCTLLVTQQLGVFSGLMLLTTSTLRIVGGEIWVMDVRGKQANETIAMRDIELQRVRSVEGVAWAVPLYWGLVQAKLPNGAVERMQLTGIDTQTLLGRPRTMLEGRVEDLRLPNAVIADQVAVERLARQGISLRVGSTLEINNRSVRVVGLCRTPRSFLGAPYLFSSYDQALKLVPPESRLLTFILAKAAEGSDPTGVAERINDLRTVQAKTNEDFSASTMIWLAQNSGVPVAFMIVVLMGMTVGMAVTGQTFYLFVHDNIRHLASMQAMGARWTSLASMVLFQAGLVGIVGYGIGLGLVTLFGALVIPREVPAFYLPNGMALIVAALIAGICLVAAWIGIWKLRRVETAMVFR
jgi:putative ABC transport system permease protein